MRSTITAAALSAALFLLAAPAYAADTQVAPTPVTAGGQIEIVAQCPTGAGSASISAAVLGGASSVPMLASSQNTTDWSVTLTVPVETLPGTYALGGTCGDGTGFTATVVVASSTGPMGGGGWAMRGPDPALLAAGAAMLAAPAAGGL
ncbi:MAG: hypothetical protein HOV79_03620, partial [Hamadaea sp.]|nr:hypothetical protein [Hamadaea sp.]